MNGPGNSLKRMFRNYLVWKYIGAAVGLAILAVIVFTTWSLADGETGEDNTETTAGRAHDFQIELFETPNYERGEILTLSELEGQPVVINFWFPSCPPCVEEMPYFEEAFQEHRDDGLALVGVQVIGIDTADDGQEFVNDLGLTFALGPDSRNEIFREYGVSHFPTTVFVDREQQIVRKYAGPLDREKLEEFISEIK